MLRRVVFLAAQKPLNADWVKLAEKLLKGKSPEKLIWKTPEACFVLLSERRSPLLQSETFFFLPFQGIDIKPIYTTEDVEGKHPPLPGAFPFTRLVKPVDA